MNLNKLIKRQYKIRNPIFEYDEKDVGYKPLHSITVRGSSKNENIDISNELFVFFLHDDIIYSWKQHSIHECIQAVCKIHSDELYRINDSNFYFTQNLYETDDCSKLIKQEIKKLSVNFNQF